MTLATQLAVGRTSFFISGIVSLVSLASAGTVGRRSAVSPRSSEGCTRSLSWVTNGRLASTIGPVDFTPGTSARANARSGGNAALSALNAGIAADRVCGSWSTVCSSALFWRANALAVVLKSVMRFSRFWGCVSSAPETSPCAAM